MKKPLFVAVAAIVATLFAACGGSSTAPTTDSAKVVMDSPTTMRPIQSPYTILYSSSFVMDDPKNAESLLAIWKAYDSGNLDEAKNLFADTMESHLASGFVLRATKDSTIAVIKTYRNSMASVSSDVNAVMAVKSTDKNEHWVLIWGMEKDTHKNGKVDSTYLQETWQFDNNGKARLLYQFAATPMKKK